MDSHHSRLNKKLSPKFSFVQEKKTELRATTFKMYKLREISYAIEYQSHYQHIEHISMGNVHTNFIEITLSIYQIN